MRITTIGPLEPHFRAQSANMSNMLQEEQWSHWIAVSKTVNVFRISWTVIEKSWPEHDPRWARLCNLLPTRSSWWRHFRYKKNVRIIEGYATLNFDVASFSIFRDILKNHFVTAAAAEAAADIDDSIKVKIRGSFKTRNGVRGMRCSNNSVCYPLLVRF